MNRDIRLRHVEEAAELAACYEVMKELRPHLRDADSFVQQVLRQGQQGFRLLAAAHGDQIVGLAGYRLQENLMYGRFIYVDDLVLRHGYRCDGVGALLFPAARYRAREIGCRHFTLATGLHMALAQRFYFRQGLLAHGR